MTDVTLDFREAVAIAHGARHLIAAILLRAALDAHNGQADAIAFLKGPDSALMAQHLGLTRWPPTLSALGTRLDLRRRALELA